MLLTVDDVTTGRTTATPTGPSSCSTWRVPDRQRERHGGHRGDRFGDNDRLAALVAHLVHADLLVLLSTWTGSTTGTRDRAGRPGDRGASRPTWTASPSAAGAAGVGTGGMLTKVEAARIATGWHPGRLTAAGQAAPALAGEPVGTIFHPTGRRRPTRLLWLAHATEAKGRCTSTRARCRPWSSGASRCCRPASRRDGAFNAGDPVDLVDTAGAAVARGLVNYDAAELPGLLGGPRDLARELGPAYEREVVHRDDLVLLLWSPGPGDFAVRTLRQRKETGLRIRPAPTSRLGEPGRGGYECQAIRLRHVDRHGRRRAAGAGDRAQRAGRLSDQRFAS